MTNSFRGEQHVAGLDALLAALAEVEREVGLGDVVSRAVPQKLRGTVNGLRGSLEFDKAPYGGLVELHM